MTVSRLPTPAAIGPSESENGMTNNKVPVFVSFDYDHDARLKDILVGQAKNDDSPHLGQCRASFSGNPGRAR